MQIRVCSQGKRSHRSRLSTQDSSSQWLQPAVGHSPSHSLGRRPLKYSTYWETSEHIPGNVEAHAGRTAQSWEGAKKWIQLGREHGGPLTYHLLRRTDTLLLAWLPRHYHYVDRPTHRRTRNAPSDPSPRTLTLNAQVERRAQTGSEHACRDVACAQTATRIAPRVCHRDANLYLILKDVSSLDHDTRTHGFPAHPCPLLHTGTHLHPPHCGVLTHLAVCSSSRPLCVARRRCYRRHDLGQHTIIEVSTHSSAAH